jgi:hypothetical protein
MRSYMFLKSPRSPGEFGWSVRQPTFSTREHVSKNGFQNSRETGWVSSVEDYHDLLIQRRSNRPKLQEENDRASPAA